MNIHKWREISMASCDTLNWRKANSIEFIRAITVMNQTDNKNKNKNR